MEPQDVPREFETFIQASSAAESRESQAAYDNLKTMGYYLGIILGSAANLLNPDLISVSGTFVNLRNPLFESAREEFENRICSGLRCKVVIDDTGDDPHAMSGLAAYRYFNN